MTSLFPNLVRSQRCWLAWAVALCLSSVLGCTLRENSWFKNGVFVPKAPQTMVLGENGLQAQSTDLSKAEELLAGGHELFRAGNYAQAEKVFHGLAEDTRKTPVHIAEEARFYEAESLRLQKRLPKAADTYNRLLKDHRGGAYKDLACQQMFEIGNYWLEDTRAEMQEMKEKREGKRSIVWPKNMNVHVTDPTKPFFDQQGRALETLRHVHYNDIRGPMGDKALFLLGAVEFYNENYKEADQEFTQLVETFPNSPFLPQAYELGIIAKHMSTGGADYDGRKVVEARDWVEKATRVPELASRGDFNDFYTRQQLGIAMQQAEKEYKAAELYRRTGKKSSAYFCYELVRRRYPGTKFYDLADERMKQLHAEVLKEGKVMLPEIPPVPVELTPAQLPSLQPTPAASAGQPKDVGYPSIELAPPPRKSPY